MTAAPRREAAIDRDDLGIAKPHLYVARWYIRVNKGGKKRIRKYLTGGRSVGNHSWTSDPTKAWCWEIQDAAKAHELAQHYKCDVVTLTQTV
jgi:hypothetical protein